MHVYMSQIDPGRHKFAAGASSIPWNRPVTTPLLAREQATNQMPAQIEHPHLDGYGADHTGQIVGDASLVIDAVGVGTERPRYGLYIYQNVGITKGHVHRQHPARLQKDIRRYQNYTGCIFHEENQVLHLR